MKLKLIINVKKLISVLLFTSLISSILPSNLLNTTVFASSDICCGITSFEGMKEAIKKARNDEIILLCNDITIPDNDDYIIIDKNITITSLKDRYKIKSQSSKSKFLDICNNCTVDLENIIIDLSQNDQYNKPIKLNTNSKLNIHPDALLVNCGTNESDILDNNATNIDDLKLTNISESDEVDNDLDLTNISESDEVDFELKGGGKDYFKINISADGGPRSSDINSTSSATPVKYIFKELLDIDITYDSDIDNENYLKRDFSYESDADDGCYLKIGFSYDNNSAQILLSELEKWNDPDNGKRPSTIINFADKMRKNPKYYIHLALCNYSGDLLKYIRTPCVLAYKDSVIKDKNPTWVKSTKKDKELDVIFNDNTVAKIVRKISTNSYQTLTTNDYTAECNQIVLKKDYLSKLNTGQHTLKISVYPRGEKDLDPSLVLPEYTTTLHVAEFNNLKTEYTYGEKPHERVTLDYGNETGAVTYSSTDTNVAKIDPDSGELNIVGAGTFQIKATINGITFTSNTITVKPKRLTLENVKIKGKEWDGTDLAEFVEEPTLNGVINGDDVKPIENPKFLSKDIGENIPVNFDDVKLTGTSASNYSLVPPDNIYSNILPVYDHKEEKIPIDKDNIKLDFGVESNYNQKFYSSDYDDSTQFDSYETTTYDEQDEIFEAEDSETEIQVYAPKGVFPKWSRLVVKEMYPNTNEYDNAYKNLDGNIKCKIENIKLYEVYVVNQYGEVIQPDVSKGLVTVRIPVPDDYDLADLQIYRIKQDADDNFETNIVNINNKNYCEFQTNHFSPYTLIDAKTISDVILAIFLCLILTLILNYLLISLFIPILKKSSMVKDSYK